MKRASSPRTLRLAAIAALGGLSACTAPPGATLVHSPLIDTAYRPNAVGAYGPAMPLQVVGEPPDGASPQEVAAKMRLPGFYGGDPMEAVPGPTEGQRVVVVFNPSNRLDWCEDPQGGAGGGPEGGMVAGLAYCRGAKELTSVVVESRGTEGPEDAGFASAMSQGMLALLPRRNPEIDPPIRMAVP